MVSNILTAKAIEIQNSENPVLTVLHNKQTQLKIKELYTVCKKTN